MKRIAIILIVVIVLFVVAAAGIYFFGPEDLKQQIGLSEPTPTPNTTALEPTPDPGVDIIVARIDLPVGTYITNTEVMLDRQNISTLRYEEDAENLFKYEQMSEVRNMVLKSPVLAGEPVKKTFLAPPWLAEQMPTTEPRRPRPKAYPVQVDSFTGVADQIKVGDSVDVLATFRVTRRVHQPPVLIPSGGEGTEGGAIPEAPPEGEPAGASGEPIKTREIQEQEFVTTKTIVQRAKVLAILRPPPPPTPVPAPEEEAPEDAPAEEVPPPAAAPAEEESDAPPTKIREGFWQVVIAVNDQQAELIEFSQQSGARVTLVLRGADDQAYEETVGVTLDLLVSEFGLPLPQPEDPFVFAEEVLTPLPTRTPAPQVRVP